MAAKGRSDSADIAWIQQLAENPHSYELFPVLRWLECVYQDKPRLGESVKASDEKLQLRQKPSLSFANSSLASFEPGWDKGKDQLTNLGFGLFGPQGALPTHLTEYALQREYNDHDPTLNHFVDIFHHRAMSLFYRAWANTEPAVEMDRPESNRFDLYVGALCGLAPKERQANDTESWPFLSRAGLLGMKQRPAEALQGILQDYFEKPFQVEQLTGGWLPLDEKGRCQLGNPRAATILGKNAVLGAQVFDLQHRFTVRCGPLDEHEFKHMLPDGEAFQKLQEFVRLFAGDEYRWCYQLAIKTPETPAWQLGRQGHLGWSSWLGKPFDQQPVQDSQQEQASLPAVQLVTISNTDVSNKPDSM